MQQQQPEDPPHEELNPTIFDCTSNPTIHVLDETSGIINQKKVFVAGHHGKQAYMLLDYMRPVIIDHGGPLDWGAVYFCSILPRVTSSSSSSSMTAAASAGVPNDDEPVFQQAAILPPQVAIKRLDKHVFHPLIFGENPHRENPYREIFRMQNFKNGEDYTLGCIEALQDDRFLYIITPFCSGRTLGDHAPLRGCAGDADGAGAGIHHSKEEQARIIYRKMLQDIKYIHDRPHVNETFGICHRDIKLQNFLVTGDGKVLLADFAMSFPIPKGGLVRHVGTFGTGPYLPPEIARQLPFHGVGCDLWACTVSLFNILTGLVLYESPVPENFKFVFCIMARALSNNPNLDMVKQVIDRAGEDRSNVLPEILLLAQQITEFSPPLKDLFTNVLALNPNNRWTVEDVLTCEWMNPPTY